MASRMFLNRCLVTAGTVVLLFYAFHARNWGPDANPAPDLLQNVFNSTLGVSLLIFIVVLKHPDLPLIFLFSSKTYLLLVSHSGRTVEMV
jgi:hypothetical protein